MIAHNAQAAVPGGVARAVSSGIKPILFGPAGSSLAWRQYYFQLAEVLRQQIKDAAAGGSMVALPYENELAEKHRISRATVRHALDLLEREGLIYRARGKGTFVARARAKYELTSSNKTHFRSKGN